LVIGRNRDKFQGLRSEQLPNITAIETSAIASIVARKLGLDGGVLVEPDITKMSGEELSKFSNNIGVVRSISQLMVKGIENALSADAAEKKLAAIRAGEAAAVTTTTTTKTARRTMEKSNTRAQAEM
jgi:hypothetical protein